MHPANGNGRRDGGFSPDQFHIREKADVDKMYDGRFGRDRFVDDRCVCTDAIDHQRPHQHGARRRVDSSFQGDWRASKVVGLNVYNDNNESIGSINDLLTDKNGNIKAVVIGVGGFLGMGAHLVAVPFDKIKFVNEPIAYTGVAGAPNAPGSRPASSTVTTGSAANNTASAAASKPNPWYPDHASLQCDQG